MDFGTPGFSWTMAYQEPAFKGREDKKKWIVDEEAAKVVQRIFNLCIAGKGPMQIAKIFTADKVLTVTAYHARQKGWVMPENLYRWNTNAVLRILERREAVLPAARQSIHHG